MPLLVSADNKFPLNSLVFITGGIHRGFVGRIDRYTAKRGGWISFYENSSGQPIVVVKA
jgi:ribosomal protein S4E